CCLITTALATGPSVANGFVETWFMVVCVLPPKLVETPPFGAIKSDNLSQFSDKSEFNAGVLPFYVAGRCFLVQLFKAFTEVGRTLETYLVCTFRDRKAGCKECNTFLEPVVADHFVGGQPR